jgi:hypothetical protein
LTGDQREGKGTVPITSALKEEKTEDGEECWLD